MARLPIPGNAEFLVYRDRLIVLGLVAKFDDHVSGEGLRLRERRGLPPLT